MVVNCYYPSKLRYWEMQLQFFVVVIEVLLLFVLMRLCFMQLSLLRFWGIQKIIIRFVNNIKELFNTKPIRIIIEKSLLSVNWINNFLSEKLCFNTIDKNVVTSKRLFSVIISTKQFLLSSWPDKWNRF